MEGDGEDISLSAFHTKSGWQGRLEKKGASLKTSTFSPVISAELQDRAEGEFAGLLNQGATCYLNSLIQTMFMTPELRNAMYALGQEELGVTDEDLLVDADDDDLFSAFTGGLDAGPPSPTGSASSMTAVSGDRVHDDLPSAVKTSTSVEVPAEVMEQALMMGFGEEQARAAYIRHPTDAEMRINFLLDCANGDMSDLPPPGSLFDFEDTPDLHTSPLPQGAGSGSDVAQQGGNSDRDDDVYVSDHVPHTAAAGNENTAPAESKEESAVTQKKIAFELQKLFAELELTSARAVSTKGLTQKGFEWERAEVVEQHDVQELNRILTDAVESQLKGTCKEDIVQELYAGKVVNQVICEVCGHRSEREETFLDLVVAVKDKLNLADALAEYVAYEMLEGDNQYKCSSCDKMVDARRGVALRTLPPMLVLGLGRFEYDWNLDKRIKINSRCSFPLTLDMASYTEESILAELKKGERSAAPSRTPAVDPATGLEGYDDNPDGLLYDLFSVVIHSGGAYGGHYHAYIRDQRAGTDLTAGWLDYDDSTVKAIDASALAQQYGGQKACAYMLVYRKRGTVVEHDDMPGVPQYLREMMDRQNAVKEAKRREAAERAYKVPITVHTTAHYYMFDGRLVSKNSSASLDPRLRSAPPPDEVRKVTVDCRGSLQSLRETLVEEFGELVPPAERMVFHEIGSRAGKLKLTQISEKADCPTLLDLGFRPGTAILAWECLTTEGEEWLGYEEKFNVKVKYYSSADVCDEFEVFTPEQQTLQDFMATMLQEKTGIDAKDQYLSLIDYYGVHPVREALSTPISELNLTGGASSLAVEKKQSEDMEHFKCHAMVAFNKRRLKFELNITDSLTLQLPAPTHVVLVERTMSAKELKELVYSKLPETTRQRVSLDNCRLRKTMAWGASGSVVSDESSKLSNLGVVDGQKIFLEEGAPPVQGMLSLRFVIGTGDVRTSQVIDFQCPRESTVLQAKAVMASLIDADISRLRVYQTDMWDSRGRFITDETLSLSKMRITAGDLLWLEHGQAPVPGQIVVSLQRFNPSREEAPRPTFVEAAALAGVNVSRTLDFVDVEEGDNTSDKDHGDITAAPPADSPDEPADDDGDDIFDVLQDISIDNTPKVPTKSSGATDPRGLPKVSYTLTSPVLHLHNIDDRAFIHAGRLDSSVHSTVMELKMALLALPAFQDVRDVSRVRLWNHTHRNRLLRDSTAPLSKYNVSNDALLTVQVLDGDEYEEISCVEDEDIVLYIHKRRPLQQLFEEGFESVFRCGAEPSVEDLMQHLVGVTDIPKEYMFIAKYSIYTNSWRVLREEDTPADEECPANAGETTVDEAEAAFLEGNAPGVRKRAHLRDLPYQLNDGDVIGVKDMRDDPAENDNFTVPNDVPLGGWSLFDGPDFDAPSTGGGRRPAEAVLRIPH